MHERRARGGGYNRHRHRRQFVRPVVHDNQCELFIAWKLISLSPEKLIRL